MGPWQIVWIVLMAISLGANLADHGKTSVRTDNFWMALISSVIVNGILYAGGFFG